MEVKGNQIEDLCSRSDYVLSNFCESDMINSLLEACSCFDLQVDLSPYGYTEYSVSRKTYDKEEEYQEAERIRRLKKSSAILKSQNSGVLTFKSVNCKLKAKATKTDSGDIFLKIFRSKDRLHIASVLIGQSPKLADDSYDMRTVIIRYNGELVARPGFFYEAVETMSRYGPVEKLNFTVFDGSADPREYLRNFSNVIDLDEISSNEIFPRELSFDKMDLVRGMSIGFHPERVEAILSSDEYPNGGARRKIGNSTLR